MVTIEELVDAVYFEYSHSLPKENQYGYETCKRALRRIATEQDRIAREKLERCINAAQDWVCHNCAQWHTGKFEYCSCCTARDQIRKAMEGGES